MKTNYKNRLRSGLFALLLACLSFSAWAQTYVCVGGTTTHQDNHTLGNSNYRWQLTSASMATGVRNETTDLIPKDPSYLTYNANSITIQWNTIGTATLRSNRGSLFGWLGFSNATNATVYVGTTPIVGDISLAQMTYCQGNAISLTLPSVTENYTNINANLSGWYLGDTRIAARTATTYTFTAANVGSVALQYRIYSNCGDVFSNSVTITVIASPEPVITAGGATTIGVGAQVGLYTNYDNMPGYTVTWTSGTPARATVNEQGIVKGVSAGAVTITAQVTNNVTGCSARATQNITVQAVPSGTALYCRSIGEQTYSRNFGSISWKAGEHWIINGIQYSHTASSTSWLDNRFSLTINWETLEAKTAAGTWMPIATSSNGQYVVQFFYETWIFPTTETIATIILKDEITIGTIESPLNLSCTETPVFPQPVINYKNARVVSEGWVMADGSAIGNLNNEDVIKYHVNVEDCGIVYGNNVTIQRNPASINIEAFDPICADATVSLTDPSITGEIIAESGKWMISPNSDGTSAAEFTALTFLTSHHGLYLFYQAETASCGTIQSNLVQLTVNPIPDVSVSVNETTLCSGDELIITLTPINGADSIAYELSDGTTGAFKAVDGQESPYTITATPVVTAITEYTVMITEVKNTMTGCINTAPTQFEGTVTVNPLPGVSIEEPNLEPICLGETASITLTSINGGNEIGYQIRIDEGDWIDADPLEGVAGEESYTISFTPNVAGTYEARIVSVKDTETGCTSTDLEEGLALATITVNPIPGAPTGDSPQMICSNESTIANFVVDGANIQWYDAATEGNLLEETTPLENGATYYASQTVSGCESADRLAVTVNFSITAEDVSYCGGENGSSLEAIAYNCESGSGTMIKTAGSYTTSGTGDAYWSFDDPSWKVSIPAQEIGRSEFNSNTLIANNFGFSIPVNADITKITIDIDRQGQRNTRMNTRGIADEQPERTGLVLFRSTGEGHGFLRQGEKGTNIKEWANGRETVSYVLDNPSWTTTNINNENFGLRYRVENTRDVFGSSATARIYGIRVTVEYNETSGINWYTTEDATTPIYSGSSFNPIGIEGSGVENNTTPVDITYYVECSNNPECRIPVQYTILETPAMNTVENVTVCTGEDVLVDFTTTSSLDIEYQWTVDDETKAEAIGMDLSTMTGNIEFTSLNVTELTSVTVTVVPVVTNPSDYLCEGMEQIFNITINPLPDVEIESPELDPICLGAIAEITLTSINGGNKIGYKIRINGGNWSDIAYLTGVAGQESYTISFTPEEAGTYEAIIVSVEDTATGCFVESESLSTATIVVNPLPGVGEIPELEPICLGATAEITLTSIDGGNKIGYQIRLGEGEWSDTAYLTGVGGEDEYTISFTPDAAGTYEAIIVSVEDTVTGCMTTYEGEYPTATIVVNPLPGVGEIPELGPICLGETAEITLTSVDGGNKIGYQIKLDEGEWSDTAYLTGVAGEDEYTISFTPEIVGTYTARIVSVENTETGCITSYEEEYPTATIVVNPLPDVDGIIGSATLMRGDTEQYFPNGTYTDGVWSASDETISIEEDGMATANAIGTATIYYTSDNGYCEKVDSLVVTVVPEPSVEISNCPETGMLAVGTTLTLTAMVYPERTSEVVWSSSNPNTAIVDATGKVTPILTGITRIIATSLDGTRFAECEIRVMVPVTGVTLNKTTATLVVGATQQLTATIMPSNASIKTVTWESSNPEFATVDATGKVTAIAVGTTVITVTTDDGGFTAICNVIVITENIRVTGVSVTPTALTMEINSESYQLTAAVRPANATNQDVTWSSSNNAAVTVDANGVIIPLATGKAVITVKTVDGSYTATSTITVVILVDSIVITPSECAIALRGSKALKAAVYPANATNKTIVWSSNDPNIATVNASGIVTAKASNGVVLISATNTQSGVSGICVVTVGSGAVPLAIDEVESMSVVVYPNPTTGFLKIENGTSEMKTIQVFDITGRLLQEVNNINQTETTLNLSDCVPGMYFLNIDGKRVKVMKQ